MPEVRKPPRQSFAGRLATQEPPAREQSPSNLNQTAFKDLNFKVSPEFHQRFKMEAVVRGLSMVDLLREMFDAYMQQQRKSDNG